ncbi:FAD-dependent oxidoreductase [Planctomycetota bacterium]
MAKSQEVEIQIKRSKEMKDSHIGRRQFMQSSAASIALAASAKALAEESLSSTQSSENFYTKETKEAEVLVVGGGTAGVIAALQTARAGCRTILVENGSMLGGTMTVGGVAFPGLFHAWGRQIIAGIGWELVTETVEFDDGRLPDFSIPTGKSHPRHQVRINPNIYALLAEEKCLQAGVELRYYETPVKTEFTDGRWNVGVVGKGTRITIRCKQLIDCTGNGYMTALAGYPVLREDVIQPGTLMFKIGEYDYQSVDKNLLKERYEKAIKDGRLVRKDFRGRIDSLLKGAGNNRHHISNADSTTSATHTATNIESRTTLLETLRFLREEVPGCEKTKLLSMQPETGIRETYRVVGEYEIAESDYTSGKLFEDAVCYSFYPIDVHDEHGVRPEHLDEGIFPTIPLRALVPKNSRNLLVAGRCASSDRRANSALRVQASCMAMGQAAGAAAVMAVARNTSPLDVPLDDIRTLLAEHDAILPEAQA